MGRSSASVSRYSCSPVRAVATWIVPSVVDVDQRIVDINALTPAPPLLVPRPPGGQGPAARRSPPLVP